MYLEVAIWDVIIRVTNVYFVAFQFPEEVNSKISKLSESQAEMYRNHVRGGLSIVSFPVVFVIM